MPNPLRIAIVAAALCVPFVPSASAAAPDKWAEQVRRLATPIVDAELVPGLVVAIYDNAATEVYALGALSANDNRPPDANTEFEIGSISKVFTCLLLADAVQRGELTLDTPLSALLPAGVEAPKRDGVEITLAHLATHSSSLPRMPGNMVGVDLKDPFAAYDTGKLYAFLNTFHPAATPGATYEYSNLAMGLLGQLLADHAKFNYPALLHDRITAPLAMTDTAISLTDDQSRRLAPPHRDGLPTTNWTFSALAGCGAIRSTANDMLKFIAAHIQPEATPLAAAINLATTRRRDVPNTNNGIALGWQIAADTITLWHNGQTGGYSCTMLICPSRKIGVIVLANGATTAVDAVGERIIQCMFGMQVEPPEVRKAVPLTAEQLDQLIGDYPAPQGFTISITRRDTALFAQLTGQEALRVFPESPTRFFYRAVPAKLEFAMDPESGRATKLTLHQNGMHIACERKQ